MTRWATSLADHARTAIERGELLEDTDAEQLAFELDALGSAVNSGWQLHENEAVFARGHRAIRRRLEADATEAGRAALAAADRSPPDAGQRRACSTVTLPHSDACRRGSRPAAEAPARRRQGRSVARFELGERDGRPLADLLAPVDGATPERVTAAVTAELKGWRVAGAEPLGSLLVAAGASPLRHSHAMSRDLIAQPRAERVAGAERSRPACA